MCGLQVNTRYYTATTILKMRIKLSLMVLAQQIYTFTYILTWLWRDYGLQCSKPTNTSELKNVLQAIYRLTLLKAQLMQQYCRSTKESMQKAGGELMLLASTYHVSLQ